MGLAEHLDDEPCDARAHDEAKAEADEADGFGWCAGDGFGFGELQGLVLDSGDGERAGNCDAEAEEDDEHGRGPEGVCADSTRVVPGIVESGYQKFPGLVWGGRGARGLGICGRSVGAVRPRLGLVVSVV